MLEVQQKALQSGLKFLAAAGAKFAVIDADGAKHGELEIAAPHKRAKPQRERLLPKGYWSQNLKPALKDMQPGDIRTVHSLKDKRITTNYMQTSVCNVCRELFGAGNFTTTRVKGEDGWTDIQVLRA